MMGSSIEWTDETWNPTVGCVVLSPGCTHCYAMAMAARLEAMGVAHYAGTTKKVNGNAVWTGLIRAAPESIMAKPLRWKRPRKIFVNSMSDLFAPGVPDSVVDRVFATAAVCPQHTFQILTKRPDRMRAYFANERLPDRLGTAVQAIGYDGPLECLPWPLPNVWLGTSVEDQVRANDRVPHLLLTPAAVRFVSAEPLLGPVDLTRIETMVFGGCEIIDALGGVGFDFLREPVASLHRRIIHQVIVGGESGPRARPMHPDWPRALREQCAHTAFFFKQWGMSMPKAAGLNDHAGWDGMSMQPIHKHAPGYDLLDGRAYREMPDARV